MTPIPLETFIAFVSPLFAVSGVVFRAGKLEEQLNAKIDRSRNETIFALDSIKDTITSELTAIKQQLAVHVVDYSNKMDSLNDRLSKLEARQAQLEREIWTCFKSNNISCSPKDDC